jgi:hypothetical protein
LDNFQKLLFVSSVDTKSIDEMLGGIFIWHLELHGATRSFKPSDCKHCVAKENSLMKNALISSLLGAAGGDGADDDYIINTHMKFKNLFEAPLAIDRGEIF